jgi:hypothetical protein
LCSGCVRFCLFDLVQLDIKITANPQRAITTTDIITCIVNVVEQFKTKHTTFKASFARVGIVDGAPDCTRFTPATYAIGAPYRDISLPKVTPALLSQVRLPASFVVIGLSCFRGALSVNGRSRHSRSRRPAVRAITSRRRCWTNYTLYPPPASRPTRRWFNMYCVEMVSTKRMVRKHRALSRSLTRRTCAAGVRLLKNVARRDVVGRLDAMGVFAVYDGVSGERVDGELEKGAAGRVSTASGCLLT